MLVQGFPFDGGGLLAGAGDRRGSGLPRSAISRKRVKRPPRRNARYASQNLDSRNANTRGWGRGSSIESARPGQSSGVFAGVTHRFRTLPCPMRTTRRAAPPAHATRRIAHVMVARRMQRIQGDVGIFQGHRADCGIQAARRNPCRLLRSTASVRVPACSRVVLVAILRLWSCAFERTLRSTFTCSRCAFRLGPGRRYSALPRTARTTAGERQRGRSQHTANMLYAVPALA